MKKIFVAMDDNEGSLRALAFGQILGADVDVISVVPVQGDIAARRSTLQS